MKNLNHIYKNLTELQKFIDSNGVKDSGSILVQVFSGLVDEDLCKSIAKTIKEKLPQASIIGTTTAGGILDDSILDLEIIVSFSLFESTKTVSRLYHNHDEAKCAKEIVDDLVLENTKAIIIFTDGLKTDGERLLREITRQYPELVIAGGKAGDNNKFKKTLVFDENTATEHGCVVASLSGDELIVNNNYMLNCEPIGLEMTVTKSEGGRVYTINGKPANEVYKKYLGEDISSKLPESGIEYPFLLERDGVTVSRSPIGAFEDGSILYAGNLKEGEKIKFGFANIDMIHDKNFNDYNHFKTFPIEATFIYSCTGRRSLLGKYMDVEFGFLHNLGSTVGFLTFGEYFHGNKINELLNLTTTFLSISESGIVPNAKDEDAQLYSSVTDTSLKVLTHLVRTTSKELNKINDALARKIDENEEVKKRLEKAQEIAHLGIWELDILGGKLFWTDEIFYIFEIDKDEFSATYENFLNVVHPDDREKVSKSYENSLKTKESYQLTHRLLMKDGRIKWVQEQCETEFDKHGNPVKSLGTVYDITEITNLYNQLTVLNKNLEQKVEEETDKRLQQEKMLMQQSRHAAMGEMIGNIAHQWRQPLSALSLTLGNLQVAYETGRLDSKIFDRTMTKSNGLIEKMSTTIDDFRNFFKPDKEVVEFDVGRLLATTLGFLDAVFRINDISVEMNYEDRIMVASYESELSQVLMNILNNAKDALIEHNAADKKIDISISNNKDKVTINIHDNAGGITENIIDRIFDPYFTTKHQAHGTGLGLYMSRLIVVEHLEGTITASNVEGGALFTVVLPRVHSSSKGNTGEKNRNAD